MRCLGIHCPQLIHTSLPSPVASELGSGTSTEPETTQWHHDASQSSSVRREPSVQSAATHLSHHRLARAPRPPGPGVCSTSSRCLRARSPLPFLEPWDCDSCCPPSCWPRLGSYERTVGFPGYGGLPSWTPCSVPGLSRVHLDLWQACVGALRSMRSSIFMLHFLSQESGSFHSLLTSLVPAGVSGHCQSPGLTCPTSGRTVKDPLVPLSFMLIKKSPHQSRPKDSGKVLMM